MNFKATRSESEFYCFHYLDGTSVQTNYSHISYYGDNYILAKRKFSNYFSLLDLEGNHIRPNLIVVFRFENGYLLTFEKWINERTSRDDVDLSTNLASYKIFDFSSGMSKTIISFQEMDMFRTAENNPFDWKVIGEQFHKKIYYLDNFVFTDIFENNYSIIGDLKYKKSLDINLEAISLGQIFKNFHNDKIWYLFSLKDEQQIQRSNFWDVYNELLRKLKIPELSNPLVTTVSEINWATERKYDQFVFMHRRAKEIKGK